MTEKLFVGWCVFCFVMIFPSISYANNFKAVFEACHVQGSTVLYEAKRDHWVITDAEDADRRTLPASTFKIFHSLIALDTGAAKPGELFPWDGQKRELAIWNKDTTLEDAFRNSTVWVYEAIEKRISKNTYARYLNWANYSNGDISHGNKDGNFWVYGRFGVSPKEQILLLEELYRNELPFSRVTMAHVRQMMFVGDSENGRVYGKTGWTRQNGFHIGWWIGYVETETGPLFFATRITKETTKALDNFIECRKSITSQIIQSCLDDVASKQ